MSKLLIDEPPLQVLPSLAVAVGLNEAIALQQLHYWLQRVKTTRSGRKWVYNSYDEWQAQFPFWSISTIRRAFTSLEKRGLVRSEQPEAHARQMRKWYTIDYEALESLSSGTDQTCSNWTDASAQSEQVDQAKLNRSICSKWPDGSGQIEPIFMHETTTETTTENTHTKQEDAFAPVGVFSNFPIEDCRKYATYLYDTKQGIKNPEGFAIACWRTGFQDRQIDQFLRAAEINQRVNDTDHTSIQRICVECGKAAACSDNWLDCPLAPVPEDVLKEYASNNKTHNQDTNTR
jgi:hypothetical protein